MVLGYLDQLYESMRKARCLPILFLLFWQCGDNKSATDDSQEKDFSHQKKYDRPGRNSTRNKPPKGTETNNTPITPTLKEQLEQLITAKFFEACKQKWPSIKTAEGTWIKTAEDLKKEVINNPKALFITESENGFKAKNSLLHMSIQNKDSALFENLVKNLVAEELNQYAQRIESYGKFRKKGIYTDTCTPIHMAIAVGSLEYVNALLETKKVNLQLLVKKIADSQGLPLNEHPLHLAARYGYDKIVTRLLQEENPPIHEKATYGFTPLHLASENGNVEATRTLLEYPGIQCDIPSDRGFTPLHEAFSRPWGHTMGKPLSEKQKSDKMIIAKLLIEKGASLSIQNEYGKTPKDIAISMGFNLENLTN